MSRATMDRTIVVVWWAGLIGALITTLAILKQVALVLRALQDILRLAQRTRDAAQGIAANVAVVPSLGDLAEPLGQLSGATGSMATSAASIEQKLAAAVGEPAVRGG